MTESNIEHNLQVGVAVAIAQTLTGQSTIPITYKQKHQAVATMEHRVAHDALGDSQSGSMPKMRETSAGSGFWRSG